MPAKIPNPVLPQREIHSEDREINSLSKWIWDISNQLQMILLRMTNAINGIIDGNLDHIALTVQTSAPPGAVDGWIAYADGTAWNPGAGRGTYEMVNNAWQKL